MGQGPGAEARRFGRHNIKSAVAHTSLNLCKQGLIQCVCKLDSFALNTLGDSSKARDGSLLGVYRYMADPNIWGSCRLHPLRNRS